MLAAEDERRTKPIDVLLVEPNPGNMRLLTESFEAATLANGLYSMSDGDAALDFLYRRGEFTDVPRPDLVLLEPKPPGTGGGEVATALNDEPALREVPVVALTGSNAEEAIVRSLDLEADHHVQKPVEPAEFDEFVESIEELWLAVVRRAPAGD